MTKQEFTELKKGDEVMNRASGHRYTVTQTYPVDGNSHISVRSLENGTGYAIMRLQADKYDLV